MVRALALFGFGLSIADPVGPTARWWLDDHLAVQAIAGWRVLGNQELEFPGPLLTVDVTWSVHLVGPLRAHAGAGGGAGWLADGCWYDAIAEVCADGTSFSALLRAPLGLSVDAGHLEVSVEAVPALRLTPELYPTFLGGLAIRWYW